MHDKFIVGVSGVILNDRGELLLLRHRFWPAGTWGLPSGYAESGETLEDGIKREIEEETKLTVEIGELLAVKSGFRLRVEATFLGSTRTETLQLDHDEVIDGRFFSINDLPEGILESHRLLIEKVRERNSML
jgi:8-oxo-dGTP diphosphatase